MIKQNIINITHNINVEHKNWWHSISINKEEGLRVPFCQIARNGNFAATMKGYKPASVLPRVFLITDFTSISKTIIKEEVK